MANPQETSVKDFDLKKEICFDSIIIKLYYLISNIYTNHIIF